MEFEFLLRHQEVLEWHQGLCAGWNPEMEMRKT